MTLFRYFPTCRAIAALILPALFLLCGSSHAQDSHYWNLQYGTRSNLLGGAVIGSVTDLGSVFYNPGMLGLLGEPSVNISAKVVQFSSLRPADEGKAILRSSSLSTLPSLAGGSFRLEENGSGMLAFSVLTRQRSALEFSGWVTFGQGLLPPVPEYDFVNGEGRYNQNMEDVWVGATWATRLSDLVGIGVSQFVSVRSQENSARLLVQGEKSTGGVSSLNQVREFEYLVYRTLTKIGVGFGRDPVTLGLTVTTPSLSIAGTGAVVYDQALSNTSADLIATTSQEDLDARYRSPFSVGGGIGVRFDSLRIHVSAEWYSGVERYDVVDAAPFSGATDGIERDVPVEEELKSVFNYGVGVEYRFSPAFEAYLAYVLDRSAATGEPGSTIDLFRNDLHQLSAGVLFAVKRSEFTVGLNNSWGPQKIRIPADFAGGTKTVELTLTQVRVIIGYAFNF